MNHNAEDLGLAAHALGLYLKTLHQRIVKNRGKRVGDRLVDLTLRDRYRRYYLARERIRAGCDETEPTLDVPAPETF